MPKERIYSSDEIVDIVKHLRSDFEEACLLSAIRSTIDSGIDDSEFEALPIGVRRSINALQKSLYSHFLLILARAYDHWTQGLDRKCLMAVFELMACEKMSSNLLISNQQKQLFDQAKTHWDALDKAYMYPILSLRFDLEQGKISNDEYSNRAKQLQMKKALKGVRDQVLAHNLPVTKHLPTNSEIRSLFNKTLEIVELLSAAIGGISVPFDAVNSVCEKQAQEFIRQWKLTTE